jgi:hypothetical protein
VEGLEDAFEPMPSNDQSEEEERESIKSIHPNISTQIPTATNDQSENCISPSKSKI